MSNLHLIGSPALVAGALDPAEFWTVSNLVHILEEGLLPSQHRHAARLMSRGGSISVCNDHAAYYFFALKTSPYCTLFSGQAIP